MPREFTPFTMSNTRSVLDTVRTCLDNDLDTPSALQAIDKAAASGADVSVAAALLGVDLTATIGPR
jgi:L-cysteine:1D-myo-inositol 2-amino-2-deoxy-alpha-D-glucopyranoside ligase